ncbi:UNVERIFIED_CONTAM: hypothetical protein FKN15_027131 [Acipenser sinensis]
MKLQAVMENLQRQQRAKLQLQLEQQQQLASQSQAQLSSSANPSTGREEPARGRPGGSPAPEEGSGEQAHTQMAALAAMRAAAAGLQRPPDSPLMEDSSEDEEEGGDEQYKDMMGSEEEEHIKKKWDEEDFEGEMEEDYDDELGEEGVGVMGGASIPGKEAPLHRQLHSHPQLLKAKGAGGQELRIQSLPSQGSLSQMPGQDHGDWTYEEQFKQLYELDGDSKRKEFLDDLFSFMQKRGTPVNRIPIMAKQVLDLYMLYMLVTEKGGLVEVINKKLWREITKGLNLPTSITSAAFTLRTQYMKYLYPYECEKRSLSNPNELQAAIDSNRREGRRQGFGGTLFTYSPNGTPTMLSSPKLPLPSLSRATNGKPLAPIQKIKKGTPVNRIPIMAKQVLDLYMLYMLVTEKGGLVEVINKKLWREITKGLNLPTSITSAAFTLRTQYMKYLYPYECEKRSLSNPNELQAAIDSNRREGRRQGFGGTLFTYSRVLQLV